MSLLEVLQEKWEVESLFKTPGRINMLREHVITLVGIKRLESEALFVSSEGGGTLRETAKVKFAGEDRYWWLARKVAGVMRRVLLSELKIQNCTVDKPCINCAVCGLLGGLNTDSSRSLQSRVKFQDLISAEPYEYDEKFRIRLPEDPNKSNPVPYQEVIVPPGTHFPFIVRIIKPSRYDLGIFLYGNAIADGLGYGNYSKLRGDASTQWVAIFDGFAHASAHSFLSSKEGLLDAMEAFVKDPAGPVNKENTMVGDVLIEYIAKVTSSTAEEGK